MDQKKTQMNGRVDWMKEVCEETNCSETNRAVPKRGMASFVTAIGKVRLLSLGEIGYILDLYIKQICML
jgi:hypothetical protein